MELEHTFTVPVGIDEAWAVLTDIERVAPCMPGAMLDTVDGDTFTGTVKVKLGPINLTYKGKASFVEKDATEHRAVIDARGKDARGNGTAAAKVRATLREAGTATTVDVITDLDITGKPAQFGRGVMADVGNKLIGQFADRLATELTSGAEGPAEAEAAAEASAEEIAAAEAVGRHADAEKPSVTRLPRRQPEPEPIDLLQHAGPAVAKRLAPVLAGLLVAVFVVLVLRRRKK